jgi:DNA-binding NtrC family response regulator
MQMNRTFLQLSDVVEQLLIDRKYPEALRMLESVDAASLPSDEHGDYCILVSETKLYLGNYSALPLDRAIETFRNGQATAKFARAKLLKGWLLLSLGEYVDAQEHCLEAYASYLRCGDPNGAARSLNRLAYACLQLGKIDTAIENLVKCVGMYAASSDRSNESVASMNLGSLYLRAGRLGDAARTYLQTQPHLLLTGERNHLIYYTHAALPFALRGDLKSAKATIAKCVPYLDTYPREKAIYYENLGLIHIRAGEYPQARKALLEGLSLSLKIAPESALVSQTKRLLADLHVAMEKDDLAQQYAEQALEVAEKIGQKVEIAACWRVLAQVAAHRRHDDDARHWYRKALDLFALIVSRYELAVTRYLAATSGLFETGERTALLYLAKEYFDSEAVAPYIEKVNTELCRTPAPEFASLPHSADDNGSTVVAISPVMLKRLNLARHVARSSMTVLLTGETGVGKDLVARYIHDQSGRAGEFVTLNSAAVPPELIEAELFGAVRGAYTGAVDRIGLFSQADGGTLYLNEIADSTLSFQVKLLEVLDSRQIRPLGATGWRKVDVRVVAATNHDLSERIAQGQFRMDLYQRLNQIPIDLPPLRDRREDIPALVEHFLSKFGETENGNRGGVARLGRLLARQVWPGNVRELETFVERIWFLGGGSWRRVLALAAEHVRGDDRNRLLDVLRACDWNQSEAARLLGCSEGTVRNRIRRYGLRKD